jgi:hypothetical protein
MAKDTNTGKDNTGENNSGYWNSGDWNSGYGNSGYGNSGYRNSGYWNSGYWNSGDWNSGYGNSGYGNSGYWNSGDWNSGYGNSSDRQSGIFNSTETTVRMFNKETNLKWDEIDHPHFNEFYLNKWISENEMTTQEKKDEAEFHIRGGYLKTFTYEEAWANFWRDTDEDNRKKFLNLPNFDSGIFKDITGIDVDQPKSKNPTTIEIDGATYKLVE